ncbi:MAG: 30S ribosomal protein S1 [Acidobacteriota bacterium]|nr:30S ribosomal protein S1 [Acidobacteriota bacterium]
MSLDSQDPITPETSVEATASTLDSSAAAAQPAQEVAALEPASAPEQKPEPEMNAQSAPEPTAEPAPQQPAEVASEPEPAANVAATEPSPAPRAPAHSAEAQAEMEAADSPAALEELIEQYSQAHQAPSEGEIFEGRVVEVTDLGVVVDIGGKAEGLVPAQEFVALGGVIPFVPGQTIEVQSADQEKEGYKVLSYLRAHRRRVWDELERAYRSHESVHGPVVERIKGGLVVDIGVRAFLPASHADLRQVQELESWIGQDVTCLILKMNRKRGNVVVSRRALLEQELTTLRQKLLETLQEGSVAVGKVKSITDYGIFVDLGGLDGLVHVTDLSWTRIKNPSEFVSVGQDLEVKVLKFDREKMRVSLGVKQLHPDPWEHVPERFTVNQRMHGTVVGITDYGAFVELEAGVEGLVHVSEMTWSRRTRHPSKIVSIGDLVEVVVLDVKPEARRISLGLKQTLPDPWETVQQKYPVGTVVAGRVRNLTDFGAFVELEEGVDGLIHVSDISWTERVQKPSEKFKKGDLVQAKVLKIDSDQRRISLGIKQMNDIWGTWFSSHRMNEIVRGKVARLTPFGAFIELAEGIEGLCHISEVEDRRDKSKDDKERQARLAAALEPGREYDFKVIKIDPEQRRIGLSLRGAQKHDERRTIEAYRSSGSSPRATIADAILAKRGSL